MPVSFGVFWITKDSIDIWPEECHGKKDGSFRGKAWRLAEIDEATTSSTSAVRILIISGRSSHSSEIPPGSLRKSLARSDATTIKLL